ncbi:MAG: helix-turn-helix domain-containing protein [Spirosomaceae bacterium]|jgi:DNA-binding transcriptional MerR regulator|nr:helix-turn-helix domain-containing protein [Spirosomataceae bacterium]
MPAPTREVKKLFYTIDEVAKRYRVDKSKIRYYEDKFELKISKNQYSGERQFTDRDLDIFDRIFLLVEKEKYTLEGAKIQLHKRMDVLDKRGYLIRRLNKLKDFLKTLEEEL